MVAALVIVAFLPVLPGAVQAGGTPAPGDFLVTLESAGAIPTVGADFLGARVTLPLSPLSSFAVHAPDPPAFLARAGTWPGIERVEPDDTVLGQDAPIPDDPLFPQQYGLPQVKAPEAWEVTSGDPDVALCIIDSGARYTHEDLAGPRYLGGKDFVNNDADPWDDNGHGTHVAGIAAATTGNGLGIAGLAQVGFYAVKTLNAANSGSWSNVAASILWCADEGPARTVISLSLGGGSAPQVVQDAVRYAYGTRGHLIVAAAGNRGCSNCVDFPARYPEVVAVACTNATQERCSFSSRGPEVEIAAPGSFILSAWNTNDSAYALDSGTSMSTPYVSGAAALAWSANPTLTNAGIRQRLDAAASDRGTPGRDTSYGYGLLDVACAVLCPLSAPTAPQNLTAAPGPAPGTANLTWERPDDPWREFITNYTVYRANATEGPFEPVVTLGPQTSYLEGPSAPFQASYYRVTAHHAGGEGAPSNVVCSDHNPAGGLVPPGLPCLFLPANPE